jgi:hypothetical protein
MSPLWAAVGPCARTFACSEAQCHAQVRIDAVHASLRIVRPVSSFSSAAPYPPPHNKPSSFLCPTKLSLTFIYLRDNINVNDDKRIALEMGTHRTHISHAVLRTFLSSLIAPRPGLSPSGTGAGNKVLTSDRLSGCDCVISYDRFRATSGRSIFFEAYLCTGYDRSLHLGPSDRWCLRNVRRAFISLFQGFQSFFVRTAPRVIGPTAISGSGAFDVSDATVHG